MSLNPCHHSPNGLGARNQYGLMVCGRCGHPYDDQPEEAIAVLASERSRAERAEQETTRLREALEAIASETSYYCRCGHPAGAEAIDLARAALASVKENQ